MIDSHCHLNDEKLINDLDTVVNNFLSAGVDRAICVGWDIESSKKAKCIASKYEPVYYEVGVHPDNIEDYNKEELEKLLSSNDRKLVAVGEIGLDYFHNKDNKEEQQRMFIEQIELANKYRLPIVIHCRDAYGDTLEILKQYAPFKYGAVMHCYSGSVEFARELLKLGVKMSFTGTVTYNNATNVKEVVKTLPDDTFFFETDSPYLTPVPNRGKTNESKYVVDVAKCVAELRGVSYAEINNITNKNCKDFFKL